MADLLIRNIDADTKRALAVRAAKDGCSQQAEALALLKASLEDEPTSWATKLLDDSRTVGGMEFEAPKRHTPRFTAIEL